MNFLTQLKNLVGWAYQNSLKALLLLLVLIIVGETYSIIKITEWGYANGVALNKCQEDSRISSAKVQAVLISLIQQTHQSNQATDSLINRNDSTIQKTQKVVKEVKTKL